MLAAWLRWAAGISIVSLVALIIVTVLVTWVVPQIANFFTSSKRALPFLTVAMLGGVMFELVHTENGK